MGLTSLMAIELRNRLEAALGRPLSATLAWNHPTIEALIDFLGADAVEGIREPDRGQRFLPAPAGERRTGGFGRSLRRGGSRGLAKRVGGRMNATPPPRETCPPSSWRCWPSRCVRKPGRSCAATRSQSSASAAEFPEARRPRTRCGACSATALRCVGDVPADRWDTRDWYDPDPAAPGKSVTKEGSFLDRIDMFDAGYFGILPREADRMDPQQRLLLEVAIEAIDDAGLPHPRLRGSRTSVYIASYHNDYAQLQYTDPDGIDARTLTGTLHSVIPNRLSYLLDLRGPSISIDSACSSSLVAIHLACQSLRSGETDLAIAGGVSLMITPELTVAMSKVGFMAPDGRCKTFDALADGFGRGEGCGIVVLKRLSDAIADNDRIHGVIRGSAVNQDGRSTLLAAPNGPAQEALIRESLRGAQLDAGRICFFETHGTGTALGDPIEVEAIAATVGPPNESGTACWLGSAKANFGHLEAAAGVVGLIKAIQVLRHGLGAAAAVFHQAQSAHLTGGNAACDSYGVDALA